MVDIIFDGTISLLNSHIQLRGNTIDSIHTLSYATINNIYLKNFSALQIYNLAAAAAAASNC